MQGIILSLDLSVHSSGYAFMKYDSSIIETGTICPAKYKNYTKDKYPVSTIKNVLSDVDQFVELIAEYSKSYTIETILIEELNVGGGKVITVKALSWIHGFLLAELGPQNFDFKFISSSTWRSALKLTFSAEQKAHNKGLKKFDKSKITHKHLAINKVNSIYGTDFEMADNDICDAIAIGLAYLVKEKGLEI